MMTDFLKKNSILRMMIIYTVIILTALFVISYLFIQNIYAAAEGEATAESIRAVNAVKNYITQKDHRIRMALIQLYYDQSPQTEVFALLNDDTGMYDSKYYNSVRMTNSFLKANAFFADQDFCDGVLYRSLDGAVFSLSSSNFNDMCDALVNYIDRVYIAGMKQKDAELKSLLAQVNPHFLYNTLEIAHMEAVSAGDVSTGHIIELLADINIPETSGLELLRRIREEGYKLRCVILSGYNDFEYVKEAARLGIENYLLKPIKQDELRMTLLDVIKKIETDALVRQRRDDTDAFKNSVMNKWVTWGLSGNSLSDRMSLLGIDINGDFYICCVSKITNAKGRADIDIMYFELECSYKRAITNLGEISIIHFNSYDKHKYRSFTA